MNQMISPPGYPFLAAREDLTPVPECCDRPVVNGAPIKSSPIQHGDRIRIGDVDMVFER
jgi:hypothetical protein